MTPRTNAMILAPTALNTVSELEAVATWIGKKLKDLTRTAMNFLFYCHHGHLSRVFTISGVTYRVCCECGAKFEYSLEKMCLRTVVSGPPDAQHVIATMGK